MRSSHAMAGESVVVGSVWLPLSAEASPGDEANARISDSQIGMASRRALNRPPNIADGASLQERRGPAIGPTRQVGLEALAKHSL